MTIDQGNLSPAELSQRRQIAAQAILSNRELLSPQLITMLIDNITPEFSQALPVLLELPQNPQIETAPGLPTRRILSLLLHSLRELHASQGSMNIDLTAVSQAWSHLAPLMTAQDVSLLSGLRERATSSSQATAVEAALFNLVTAATDQRAARAALNSFQESAGWGMLSPVQQEALVEFGTTGRTNNLASIGEACDTICGEAPHYPLAVMLRRLGLPDATSDSEVCQLARRISSRTGPGNIGTIRTWLTPIIGSALLAWHNCVTRHTATAPEETRTLGATLSATYSSREQFLLAVLGDLASSGNLNPSRAFLRTYTADFELKVRNESCLRLLV